MFAWNAYEVPRVDSSFIYHHLNINPSITPKKQPPQRSSKDHSDAIKDEMVKLKQAGAIKKVFYPKWLANIVVVKKKNGKWRVYVSFTDLNKGLPKRSIHHASNKLDGGCHYRSFSDELFGRLSRLPPDTFNLGGSGKKSFCHSYWKLPL